MFHNLTNFLQVSGPLWMNNEAITVSDWYDGGDVVLDSYLQSTTAGILKNKIFGEYVTINNSTHNFGFTHNRSWCTALLRDITGYPQGWVKIPCEENFNASYFCEFRSKQFKNEPGPDFVQWKYENLSHNKSGIRYINHNGKDYFVICPPRWIQIGMTCFRLFEEAKRISFYDSEKVCKSHDSNIVMVDFKATNESSARIYTNFMMRKDTPKYRESFYERAVYDIISARVHNNASSNGSVIVSDKMKNNFLRGGFVLSENDMHPQLARILEVLYLTEPPETTSYIIHSLWLANSHQKYKCLLLVPTYYNFFEIPNHSSQSMTWFVRDNSCNATFLIKFALCQKDSIKVSLSCAAGYFKCWDESCILDLYVCDGDNDCLAGDDEATDCEDETKQKTKTVSARRLLSTSLNYCKSSYISDRKGHHKLPVHFYCDNIIHCSDKSDEFMCPSLLSSDSRFYKTTSGEALHSCQKSQLGPKFSFGNLCRYKRQLDGVTGYCLSGKHLDTCAAVECSGMFKCFNSYCIPLHYICDGFSDCYRSEDEQGCSDLSCPGLLRCRGTESRCVGQWQICDGFIDCPSADDEILCHKCPLTCVCQSFQVWCWSNKIPLSIKHIQQTKYFTMMAYQPILNISSLMPMHSNNIILQYIFSSIRKIDRSTESNATFHTLCFSLSYNNIAELNIIHFVNFKHLLVLDVSNNYIHFLKGSKKEVLPSLSVLLLNNNSLTIVSGLWNRKGLQMVSLLNNPDLSLLITTSFELLNINMIYVDFESVCCEAYQTNICVSTIKLIKCGSLLNLPSLHIPLLCIAIILSLKSCLSFRALFKLRNKHTAYERFLFNLGLSSILCGAYLFSISMMSIVMGSGYSRHTSSWITGVSCGAMNFGLAVSIQISKWVVITKSLLLNLAIANPFGRYKSPLWRAHWIPYNLAWVWSILCGLGCFSTYSRVVNGQEPMSTSRGMCASIILVDTFSLLSRLFSILLILDSCLVIALFAISSIITYRLSTIRKCFDNKAARLRKSRLYSNLVSSFMVHFLVFVPLIIYQVMFYIGSDAHQNYCQVVLFTYIAVKEIWQFSYYVLRQLLKKDCNK